MDRYGSAVRSQKLVLLPHRVNAMVNPSHKTMFCSMLWQTGRTILRSDIAALTPEVASVSGIPLVSDSDAEEVGRILG